LLVWQGAFFFAPLVFLIVLTFWSVRSFRVQPDATLKNWIKILTTDYVWSAYLRSVVLSACCSLITSAAAFPFAYFVAFRLSMRARLFAPCLLIVPFFTSYLVRVYTWRTMLGQHGAVNNLLAWIGLPAQTMTDNFFGVMVGFVTLILARWAPVVTRMDLPGDASDRQSRYLEVAINGVLVASVYAPNGNPQPGPKFDYKLVPLHGSYDSLGWG
jgi:ABC-type Fe3+ transport system permease subunit